LVACSEALAERISREVGRRIAPHELLFDAPPARLEVQFNVDIYFPKESCFRKLEDVSPVVRTLAREQFDDFVKRVRIFVHPRLAEEVSQIDNLPDLVVQAIEQTDD
jgi:hypothetical protein